MQNTTFSQHAQQVLTAARGEGNGPGSDPSIARSWLRCLEDYLRGVRMPLETAYTDPSVYEPS